MLGIGVSEKMRRQLNAGRHNAVERNLTLAQFGQALKNRPESHGASRQRAYNLDLRSKKASYTALSNAGTKGPGHHRLPGNAKGFAFVFADFSSLKPESGESLTGRIFWFWKFRRRGFAFAWCPSAGIRFFLADLPGAAS
jgi:hypothetical protein